MGLRGRAQPAPNLVRVGDTLVLQPTGGLDLWASFDAPDAGIPFEVSERVVVDMSLVGQLDHATAASLVALGYELRQRGSQLVLAALSPALALELARLQLDRDFTIARDVESALSAP